EYLAARFLAVHDTGHVDPRLADEIAAELDDDAGLGKSPDDFRDERLEVLADRREIERGVSRKVRNPEAAADVEKTHGRRGGLGEAQGELDRLALRLDEGSGAKVLRAGEDVESV